MQPRQERGQQRRDAIIGAAADIAAEHGFAVVSHRTVAARAGVPLGSTTYYFRSLDDLLGAVAGLMIEGSLARGAAVSAEADAGPYSSARAAALLTKAILPADEHHRVLFFYEQLLGSARHPAVASVLNDARPRLERMVGQALATTGFSGRVSPGLVLAVVDGATVGALSEGRTDLRAYVTTIVTDLLDRTYLSCP